MATCKDCKDCLHYELCGVFGYISPVKFCGFYTERSRFIELPCKVGDILYHPVPLRNMIAEYKIKSFQIYPHCVWVNWNIVDGVATINTSGIYANEIGETVFFTKEAAEQALKERGKNENV